MDARTLDPTDNQLPITDWWEHHHQGHGDCRFWLTGSPAERVWYPLAIQSRLRRGRVVLNIGVGLGHCTRALVRRGCLVHALDIAPAALAKVEGIVAKTWLADNLTALPPRTFDVAISHLVAQHMSDEQLLAQLSAVTAALKPDGVFALQFGTSLDPTRNDAPCISLEDQKKGSAVRTLGHVARLVERAGGLITWSNRIGVFPEYHTAWYAVHITRADFPVTSSVRTSSTLLDRLRFGMLFLQTAATKVSARVLGRG